MKKRSRRRITAIISIALLLLLYLSNLVLALIGTEEARDLLKITLTFSIILPILLYGMLVVMQKTSRFRQDPEEELTPEQREEARRKMQEEMEKEQKKNDGKEKKIQGKIQK